MAVADRGLLLVGLEAGGSIYERLPGLRRSSSVLLEQVLVFLSASCSQTTSFVMVSQVCSLSFRFPTLDLKTQQLGPPRTLFLVDLLRPIGSSPAIVARGGGGKEENIKGDTPQRTIVISTATVIVLPDAS